MIRLPSRLRLTPSPSPGRWLSASVASIPAPLSLAAALQIPWDQERASGQNEKEAFDMMGDFGDRACQSWGMSVGLGCAVSPALGIKGANLGLRRDQ